MNAERSRLVARAHEHLERRGRPRQELFAIVALSGMAGFLVSYALLGAGLSSMAMRYGISGASGYFAFLSLIAVWIAWKRRFEGGIDGLDAIELLNPIDYTPRFSGRSAEAPGSAEAPFAGGRSGGGGATGAWDHSGGGVGGGGGGSWFDTDDLGWVLLVAVIALSGVLAIGYVVYLAPLLLAEVLVDAVIVATISRRIAVAEKHDWTATVLRRTWLPATVLMAVLVIGGWTLQTMAPDARSIGPAVRELLK